jgi:DNA-binding transcriptional ArsR family regulator
MREDGSVSAPRYEAEPVVLRDAAAIKALTHPARLAVLDELFSGRELTATECAEIAGISPSAMSYHLRALAKAGIVVPGETTTDGRRRPWRAAGTGLRLKLDDSDAATRAAGYELANTVLGQLTAGLQEWMDRSGTEDQAWREASGMIATSAHLDLQGAREVYAALRAAMADAERRDARRQRRGTRRMRLGVLFFPDDSAEAQTTD